MTDNHRVRCVSNTLTSTLHAPEPVTYEVWSTRDLHNSQRSEEARRETRESHWRLQDCFVKRNKDKESLAAPPRQRRDSKIHARLPARRRQAWATQHINKNAHRFTQVCNDGLNLCILTNILKVKATGTSTICLPIFFWRRSFKIKCTSCQQHVYIIGRATGFFLIKKNDSPINAALQRDHSSVVQQRRPSTQGESHHVDMRSAGPMSCNQFYAAPVQRRVARRFALQKCTSETICLHLDTRELGTCLHQTS